MTACIVVLCVLALIALLLLLPLGVIGEYSREGVLLQALAGPVRIALYPRPKKEKGGKDKKGKKEKKAKKKKAPKPEAEPQPKKPGGSFALIRALLPIVCEALGKLKGRLRISLTLYYTAGGLDAAQTAIQYGEVSAGLGAVQALLENSFRIEKRDIRTAVDFTAEKPVIYLWISVKIRVGQLLYLGLRYGFACLRVYLAHRRKQRRQPPKAAEDKAAQQEKRPPEQGEKKKAV